MASREATPRPAPGEQPLTVLLEDDQAIVGASVRHMLAGEPDITLHFCQDPAKAIGMANEVRPTMMLQDLVMPDIDGLAWSSSSPPTRRRVRRP
jgi:PleD family two-component response regulator